jgi:hypothetical protein
MLARVIEAPRPLLLMDVDGVLNPYPDCLDGFREYDALAAEAAPCLAPGAGLSLRLRGADPRAAIPLLLSGMWIIVASAALFRSARVETAAA